MLKGTGLMSLKQGFHDVIAILGRSLPTAGLDIGRLKRTVRGTPRFVGQYRQFRAESRRVGLPVPNLADLFPILGEDGEAAGGYDAQYLHQDFWAARRLYDNRPHQHVDVSSRVDGFVTSALVFCPIMMVDVRPFPASLPGLTFRQTDATRLPFEDSSVASISSLHAMEHFGLGRYGDALNPSGTIEALAELARVAAPGGRVYLGLPTGRTRVMFNAHRVLSPSLVLNTLAPLRLLSFAAVNDDGDFIPVADPADFENAFGSCGLFELTKD
jgi:SAM-dependent methyltransferase